MGGPGGDGLAAHVLGPWRPEERASVALLAANAAAAARLWLTEPDVQCAMGVVNDRRGCFHTAAGHTREGS